MSKLLATINTSVPLDIDLPAMKYQEPDNDRLIEIYKRLEFNVFLKKLAASGGKTMTAGFSSENEKQESRKSEELTDAFSFLFTVSPSAEILRVDSREAADRMKADLWQQPAVWLKVFHDNSHISQPKISSVCLASEKNLYCVFMDGSGTEEKTDWLREFFAQFAGRICGHDIKKDYYALFCAGTGGRTDEKDRRSRFYPHHYHAEPYALRHRRGR